MTDINTLLNQVASTMAGGGAGGADFYPCNVQEGQTVIIPIRDPRISTTDVANKLGLFASATDYYAGTPSNKMITLAVVLFATETQYLTKGWDGNWSSASPEVQARQQESGASHAVVPFAFASTLGKKWFETFQTDPTGLRLSTRWAEVRPDGTLDMTGVSPLLIGRKKGKGKQVDYSVEIRNPLPPQLQPRLAAVQRVLLPLRTLPEIAADYTRYRKEQSDKKQAEANGVAPTVGGQPTTLQQQLQDIVF